jgi:hypothetical protein
MLPPGVLIAAVAGSFRGAKDDPSRSMSTSDVTEWKRPRKYHHNRIKTHCPVPCQGLSTRFTRAKPHKPSPSLTVPRYPFRRCAMSRIMMCVHQHVQWRVARKVPTRQIAKPFPASYVLSAYRSEAEIGNSFIPPNPIISLSEAKHVLQILSYWLKCTPCSAGKNHGKQSFELAGAGRAELSRPRALRVHIYLSSVFSVCFKLS